MCSYLNIENPTDIPGWRRPWIICIVILWSVQVFMQILHWIAKGPKCKHDSCEKFGVSLVDFVNIFDALYCHTGQNLKFVSLAMKTLDPVRLWKHFLLSAFPECSETMYDVSFAGVFTVFRNAFWFSLCDLGLSAQ